MTELKAPHATVPKGLVRDINVTVETVIRVALACVYFALEYKTPFKRKIQPEELWMYRNPRTDSYVPLSILWPVVLGVPGLFFILYYSKTRNWQDLKCTLLAFTLNLGLNGVITNTIKITVGRPRPDFYWRCFPDGQMNADMECTGDWGSIMDGRKSFPSGHSSFAFAGLGFLTWYLLGKLQVFNERGRGHTWRLVAAGLPLFAALMIAISRTCDYHHHWQDVTVGALIGAGLSFLSYRQYYPAFASRHCYLPSRAVDPARTFPVNIPKRLVTPKPSPSSSNNSDIDTRKLLDPDEKDAKWI